VQKFPDRTLAIAEAGKIAQKGDIILLMGKGPETYQEIKGVKHPWSDREKLEQALT
jgi:UDP-N-acetylmuramoyl-L-alanyl-D-glutamate--2,6-diaminopimelate ligase